jgi:hypothetical protein
LPVEPDFLAILEILDRHEVEFVICGGIAFCTADCWSAERAASRYGGHVVYGGPWR